MVVLPCDVDDWSLGASNSDSSRVLAEPKISDRAPRVGAACGVARRHEFGIRTCRYGCGFAHPAALRCVSLIYENGCWNVHVPVVRGIQFSRQHLYVLGAVEHRARSSSLQKLSRARPGSVAP